jgi:hypothetical protein
MGQSTRLPPLSASRHVSTDVNQNIKGLTWRCSDCIATAAPVQSAERERRQIRMQTVMGRRLLEGVP